MPNHQLETNTAEIKSVLGITCPESEDSTVKITELSSLAHATSTSLCFCTERMQKALKTTKAGAVILSRQLAEIYSGAAEKIVHENPTHAFAQLLAHFYAETIPKIGVSSTAVCDPSAIIHQSAYIGPNVVIGAETEIKAGAIIHAGTVIGKRVVVDEKTLIHPNVTVYDGVTIGARCIIHSGAVIGSDGFGYAIHQQTWQKIPHIGSVRIHDAVEIGANTCIDRGMLDNTIIGTGTKIDNHVHIAHNVVLGAHCAIAGCVGIAGSTTIGNHVRIGGCVGVNGQITICDHAVIGGGTNVTGHVKTPGLYVGIMPIQPHKNWAKASVAIKKLGQITTQKSSK